MNVSVDDDGGLGALATTAPDVNASQGSSLDRVAKSHNLGLAGVAGLQVAEELEVIGVRVVRCKPRLAGHYVW